jgi:hypothetical protein
LAGQQEDGRAAKAFCESPGFKSLPCAFACDTEAETTTKKMCYLCGTLYFPMPEHIPFEVSGVPKYPTYGVRLISLACKGPVVIRYVFKITSSLAITKREGYEGTNCTRASLAQIDEHNTTDAYGSARNASPIVRCELELPNIGDSEEERAVKAKETNCWL